MEADPLACLPTLSQNLHERFSGPHTQYGSNCFYTLPSDGSMVHATVIVSCTQILVCDPSSFVLRVALVEKLLAMYQRNISSDEKEVMLVFDGEHDMLLRGAMVCEGQPAKPFVATVKAMYNAHYPDVPFTLHMDVREPLRDIAKLKVSPTYTAPMPVKEGEFANCPCWRPGDVINISSEEFARRVRNIFIVYAPEKLATVPEICRKYNKKRGGAIQYLVSKYGPEPSEEHARSVRAVQEREEKFNELVNPNESKDNQGANSSIQLPQLLQAQKERKISDEQPLTFAQLLLSNRPSGGLGRVQLRVTPIPFLQPQQPYTLFKRRNNIMGQFWYLCNEGYVLAFETSDDVLFDKYGYRNGDRLLATWGTTRGKWSTVIGVRDGALWVHDDGEMGATMLAGFESKEDLERSNGWMLGGKNSIKQVDKMCFYTHQGNKIWLHVRPEDVYEHFGCYHGEVLVPIEDRKWENNGDGGGSALPDASSGAGTGVGPEGNFMVIVGVEAETGSLFAHQFERNRPVGVVGGSKRSSSAVANASARKTSEGDVPAGWGPDLGHGLALAINSSGSGEDVGPLVRTGGLEHVPVVRLDRCSSTSDIARRYGFRSNGGSYIVRGLPSVAL